MKNFNLNLIKIIEIILKSYFDEQIIHLVVLSYQSESGSWSLDGGFVMSIFLPSGGITNTIASAIEMCQILWT
jgi:hypothetical protein